MIGNDVVDLGEAGEPSARFVERVFTPAERERVRAGGAAAAWRLWAAKEAAYKALARRDPELPFAHGTFVVDVERGVVRHGADEVRVTWGERGRAVVCVAHAGDGRERLSAVAAVLDVPEAARAPESERPSVAARWLVRRLLGERLGAAPEEIEVVREERGPGRRPGPPEVRWRGRKLDDVQISLAHDGEYVACALELSPSPSARPPQAERAENPK
jgi:phosphopantetheinyl transferase (holo-ACP synthase)